jgi:type IV pilus assembly protein PilB
MGLVSNSSTENINLEFEEREVQQNSQKLDLPYINLVNFPMNIDVLKIISPDDVLKTKVFPFDKVGKKLRVAIVDPDNLETKTQIERLGDKFQIKRYLCSNSSFEFARSLYKSEFLNKRVVQTRHQFHEQKRTLESQFSQFPELEKKLPNLPAETALNEIEIAAIKNRATDIHLQPHEKGATCRFRVDGLLYDILEIDQKTAQNIIARIKFESGMKLNISDIPQDGHITFIVNQRKIDFRVSALPTEFCESIVMRILDSSRGIQDFATLGFSEKNRAKIEQNFQKKGGITLVTGPTGSGKTTTLYSMLKELNSPEKKCVTLEDPIEYHLMGVTQSPVNQNDKYNFSNGLRAILRQDPDVILVGEIRDTETAKLSIEASLTGHTVLSSLHTNSAIGAITRLRNLGLKDYNLSSALNAIFAQRLVRKLCPNCTKKKKFEKNKFLEKIINRLQVVFPNLKIPNEINQAVGCELCSHTGYLGQVAVCEGFVIDKKIRLLILEGASEDVIKKYLRENTNFLKMAEDGILKVFAGETSLEEVYRVI